MVVGPAGVGSISLGKTKVFSYLNTVYLKSEIAVPKSMPFGQRGQKPFFREWLDCAGYLLITF